MAHPLAYLPPELQSTVWTHLDSHSQRKFRLLSSHSRAYADSRIETIWVADDTVERSGGRAPCPANSGAVVAFLRAFFDRGGRPSTLHLRLPGMAGRQGACAAHALAVLRALRAARVTSLRRLVLEGVQLSGVVTGAIAAVAPRLEDITCFGVIVRRFISTLDQTSDEGMAALVEFAGPGLRRLVLAGREASSRESTMGAVVQSAPMLEELELPDASLTRPLAAQLCRLPRLQRLKACDVRESNRGSGDDPNAPVPLPPTLRHLGIYGDDDMTASEVSCLEFPPSCTSVELGWLTSAYEQRSSLSARAEELEAVRRLLAKLRGRAKGQRIVLRHFHLPPPGFAGLMPDLGAMELRGLDLFLNDVTAEDLRAAAVHLRTVEDLTLSIGFPPGALKLLYGTHGLKNLQLDLPDMSEHVAAAWGDEAAVREALVALLTGPAPLLRLEVSNMSEAEVPRRVSAAIASAAAAVRGQLAAAGRDPAALVMDGVVGNYEEG